MTGFSSQTIQHEVNEMFDALMKSHARYRDFLQLLPVGVLELDLEGRVLFANRAACDTYQYSGQDLCAMTGFDLHSDEAGRARMRETLGKALAGTAESRDYYCTARRKDGALIEIQATWDYRRDDGGQLLGFIVIITDVTETKIAAMARERILSLLRATLESTADGILIIDTQGRIVDYNQRFLQLWGIPARVLENDRADETILTYALKKLKSPEAFLARVRELYANPEKESFDDFELNDGRVFERYTHPQWLEGGVIGRVWSFRDVTERRLAEEASRESQRRLREMLDTVSEIALMLDAHGTITYANDYLLELTGWTRQEILGGDWFQMFIPAESSAEIREIFKKSFDSNAGCPPHHENEILTRHGERRLIAWDNTTLRDRDGRPIGTASLGRDITSQRLLEEQLRQSQKMDAIGQLAGGIAHDFNNLLTGILGYANIIKLEAPEGGPLADAAKTIETAAERAAQLTGQLLGFARRGKFLATPVNISEIVTEVIGLLGRTIDKNISITQRNRLPRACVLGDPGQIQQVVLNLAINARDAMPGGGELTLETGGATLTADTLPHISARPGDYVVLTVSDTGCGIPPELQQRIFEPFFTTKAQGKGTGMGLAMAYGIVNNHGGFIVVESEVGRGTTFRIHLPLHAEEQPAPRLAASGQPPRGSGQVLLVDDEDVIRNVTGQMLRRLGYTVLAAAGGAEAVAIYRDRAAEIDLVLIDMVMPGLDGRETFMALKALNPSLRAILSSGYAIDGRAQEILDEGMRGFIQKPYRMQELAETLTRALAREE